MARRRTDRRKEAPDPVRHVEPQRASPRPSQRSTFRAAHARQNLAAMLPDVVYSKPRPRARVREDTAPAPLSSGQTAARTKRAVNNDQARPDRQKLRDLDRCKSRPDSRKRRKAGSGGSRHFVPWCR